MTKQKQKFNEQLLEKWKEENKDFNLKSKQRRENRKK